MNNSQKSKNSFHSATSVSPMKLWQDRTPAEEVRIEIVPLIDVIFCILTFFILGAVGLSRQQAINLDLPKAQTGTSQMQKNLVVSIDNSGLLYVEKQPTNKTQLNQAVVNYYQQNPSGIVVLNASRNTSYNNVVEILDLLRSVGGDRIALATLPGEAGGGLDQGNLNLNQLTPLPNQNNLGLPGQNQIPNNNLPSLDNSNNNLLPQNSLNNNQLPSSNSNNNLLPQNSLNNNQLPESNSDSQPKSSSSNENP